jgi:hypothetical protein
MSTSNSNTFSDLSRALFVSMREYIDRGEPIGMSSGIEFP